MKVLFYALGGGAGHLCRSLAVARHLLAIPGVQARLLVPGRLREWVTPPLTCGTPPGPDKEKLTRWLDDELSEYQPDVLVVDLYPSGVFQEFPANLGITAVLLTRWVGPDFYAQPEAARALAKFAAIYSSEPFEGAMDSPAAGKMVRVEPVVCSTDLLSRASARERLGAGDRPLVLAIGSGPKRSQTLLRERLARLCAERHWDLKFCSPLLNCEVPEVGRLLHGADLVVSAPGYQAFHEVLQSGVPAVFLPQRAPHDNQFLRSVGRLWTGSGPMPVRAPLAVARSPQELEAAVADLMKKPPATPIRFLGARQVAEHLGRVVN